MREPIKRETLLAAGCLFLGMACTETEPTLDGGPAVDARQSSDAPIDGGGDTWRDFAAGFFETYCVECHDALPRDFRRLDSVRDHQARIRCGVSAEPLTDCTGGPPPRQFPIGDGPFPSDPERTRLVDWIERGLPQ